MFYNNLLVLIQQVFNLCWNSTNTISPYCYSTSIALCHLAITIFYYSTITIFYHLTITITTRPSRNYKKINLVLLHLLLKLFSINHTNSNSSKVYLIWNNIFFTPFMQRVYWFNLPSCTTCLSYCQGLPNKI